MAIQYQIVRALNPTFDPRAAPRPCCNPCAQGKPCASKCERRRNPSSEEEPKSSRRIRNLANRLSRGETR